MEKLDSLILNALADKVFDPERVKTMLSDMKKHAQKGQAANWEYSQWIRIRYSFV